jgi:hypothetical protein
MTPEHMAEVMRKQAERIAELEREIQLRDAVGSLNTDISVARKFTSLTKELAQVRKTCDELRELCGSWREAMRQIREADTEPAFNDECIICGNSYGYHRSGDKVCPAGGKHGWWNGMWRTSSFKPATQSREDAREAPVELWHYGEIVPKCGAHGGRLTWHSAYVTCPACLAKMGKPSVEVNDLRDKPFTPPF